MLLRVPELQQSHAEVKEDDAVHGGAQHADEVVHRDVRLFWDVFECVVGLNNATTWPRQSFYFLSVLLLVTYEADDAWPVQQLGGHVGGVGQTQNGQRLNNPDLLDSSKCIYKRQDQTILSSDDFMIYLWELCDEGRDETEEAANGESPNGDGEEGGDAQHNIHGNNILPRLGHA